ncbi:MAG: hypothetical protein DMG69_31615, partial [Acidobacteria bacterium]
TGIAVLEGDNLNFEAAGRVNIDLEGLVLSLAARHEAEQRVIAEEKKAGTWETQKIAPELRFTPEEKLKVRPQWKWIDPNGIPETEMVAANPARRKRSILPAKGYGALLAAIRETGVEPSREDAFFVGRSNTCVTKRSGKLYFVVNDIWNDQDKEFPEMLMVDNVGFFYARVTVTPRK